MFEPPEVISDRTGAGEIALMSVARYLSHSSTLIALGPVLAQYELRGAQGTAACDVTLRNDQILTASRSPCTGPSEVRLDEFGVAGDARLLRRTARIHPLHNLVS